MKHLLFLNETSFLINILYYVPLFVKICSRLTFSFVRFHSCEVKWKHGKDIYIITVKCRFILISLTSGA